MQFNTRVPNLLTKGSRYKPNEEQASAEYLHVWPAFKSKFSVSANTEENLS